MLGVFKETHKKIKKVPLKIGKELKSASSLVELLLILTIVGVLAVLYLRTIDRDAIATKYAYRNLINDMISFGYNQTNAYTTPFASGANICNIFFDSINTLGDKNCSTSRYPDVPNLTTTSGMRFYGLEQTFQSANPDDGKGQFIMITVDLDGLYGENMMDKDTFTFELMQSGRVRPAGAAVINSDEVVLSYEGNIARDPSLYTAKAYYVPSDAANKSDYQSLGNNLSFAEAQCLSGNIFPYRESSSPFALQMCIKDNDVVNAIANGDADEREAAIKEYLKNQATGRQGINICDNLYNNENSVAKDLLAVNNTVVARCQKCYKAVYKAKYCQGVTSQTDDCPQAVLNETGVCTAPEWAVVSY